ncbi:MAG: hypothetical protein ACFB6R_08950 [Alphaproteobacteria bacterium]
MTDRQEIAVDTRVETGTPGSDDFDTGRVVKVEGDVATVAWDRGQNASHPVADLRVAEDA